MASLLEVRCLVVALALLLETAPVTAQSRELAHDPRTIGLTPIWAHGRGNEVVRIDRWPNGRPSRCVRAARLATPAEGGPSGVEFGVERSSPDAADVTMFFRIRYLDGPEGRPLAVRDPVMAIRIVGPTDTWRVEQLPGGWFRGTKSAVQSNEDERFGFVTEVEKTGNEFVSTFPDGSHRLHYVRGGLSPWHFEMFVNCVCALSADLPRTATRGFLCE